MGLHFLGACEWIILFYFHLKKTYIFKSTKGVQPIYKKYLQIGQSIYQVPKVIIFLYVNSLSLLFLFFHDSFVLLSLDLYTFQYTPHAQKFLLVPSLKRTLTGKSQFLSSKTPKLLPFKSHYSASPS